MPYFLNTDEEQRAMLAAIGAGSIEELFAMIPADVRAGAAARRAAGDGRDGIDRPCRFARSAQRLRGAGRLLPRRRRLRPLHPRGGRFRRLPQRVLHLLHALPGRSQPGQPPGAVRVPDAGRAVDRHGRVEFEPLRRRQRRGRGGVDGRPRHAADGPRRRRRQRPSRIPANTRHLPGQPRRRTGRGRRGRRRRLARGRGGGRQRRDGLRPGAASELFRLPRRHAGAGRDRAPSSGRCWP